MDGTGASLASIHVVTRWLIVLALVATTACGRPEPPTASAVADAAPKDSAPRDPASPQAPAPSPAPASPEAQAPPQGPPQEPAPSADATPPDELVARLLLPWHGDLDRLLERRYIRMLVTFNKTHYFLDGARQRGATYEGGRLFEDALNAGVKDHQKRVTIVFLPVSRDRLLQALIDGHGDIAAANLTITPARQKLVDFAAPFTSRVSEVVVTAADEPAVSRKEDLSGREVYVRRSSSYYDSLEALNAALSAAGKPPVTIVPVSEQLEDEDILEMVHAGLIPATVVDNHLATLWTQVLDRIRAHPDVTLRTGGQIAWAIRRGSPRLRAAIDAFVAKNREGSLMFNLLTQRYFKSTQWVKNAAAQEELRKLDDTVAFFRRYGDRYDLPWLLVAAQAYQESTIDQNKRSRAGAVGVMQIKPETAAGSPINIQGVDRDVERNIHAGVKYLRFIVDRYYENEPMDRLNKGLFAMASYNAGPARVAQLRKKARALGLDPNKWFGNVEVVAARDIGRETVQYVSNIYKYYVAYNLVMQEREARRRARTGKKTGT
jgi:membrane-bound lytic murein transglycosylase MltF